ncbi:MAG: transporter substrate-binding domain-containing protein [Pseudomonadota bacterium]
MKHASARASQPPPGRRAYWRPSWRALAALAALALCWCAGAAHAACSRPIKVPVSPAGGDLAINSENQAHGIGADMLASVTNRTGCQFEFVSVPRVRGLEMFRAGAVDLLTSVVQTAERDEIGEFVAFTSSRVAAIGMRKSLPAGGAPDDKLSGSYLVNVVRGYDYGPAYRTLLQSLRAQHRLEEVTDPLTAARKLAMGRAGVILIAPGAFIEAAERAAITAEVQAFPLASIPPFLSGVYVSRGALGEADRAALATSLREREVRQKYWAAVVASRLPAWVLAGAKMVD